MKGSRECCNINTTIYCSAEEKGTRYLVCYYAKLSRPVTKADVLYNPISKNYLKKDNMSVVNLSVIWVARGKAGLGKREQLLMEKRNFSKIIRMVA